MWLELMAQKAQRRMVSIRITPTALCFAEPRKVVVGMLRSASGSCYRTKKASFHAVGAPDCPALGHLAAVWWESASRVEQVSCQ